MTRCSSRTLAFIWLLVGASLSLPNVAQELPERTFPAPGVASWVLEDPATLRMDATRLAEAQAYAETKLGAGIIARRGHKVLEWGDPTARTFRYPVASVTKGIGALLLGLAIKDGLVVLENPAFSYFDGIGIPPDTNGTGDPGQWRQQVTLEQLATHSSGFETPGGAPKLDAPPGTIWTYSDGGANWLADTLTVVYRDDLRKVLQDRILVHLGLTMATPENQAGDVFWRDHSSRASPLLGFTRREFNAGISLTVDAMARIGLLVESDGKWNGTDILSAEYLTRMATPSPIIQGKGLPIRDSGGRDVSANFPNVTEHLGLLWFNNADGALENVPTDAFWTWGDGDHLIVVIPSLELAIARTSNRPGDRLHGDSWQGACPVSGSWCTQYSFLDPFLTPIVQSVQQGGEPPPPPEAPTVTLTSNVSEVTAGGTATLTWSSANATACTASNGWSGTREVSGTETVTVSQTTTYTLACTGAGGTTEASVSITATAAQPPPPPPPPPSDGGGGGGGALQWWLLAALFSIGGARLALRSRRRALSIMGG